MTLLASPDRPLLRRLQRGAAALCRLAAPAAPVTRTLQPGSSEQCLLVSPADAAGLTLLTSFARIMEDLAQLDFSRAANSGYLALPL